jgi:hypothetical protein
LESAAGAIKAALEKIKEVVPSEYLKKSLLANGKSMSSSCTGVYTAEVAMGIVQKTWNKLGSVDMFKVDFQSFSCHEPGLE